MSFRALCVSRLSDGLALSGDPVARFADTLIEIAGQTVPGSRASGGKLPRMAWFDDVCRQAVRERERARRGLFWNPSAESVHAFEQLRATAGHVVRTRRRTSLQGFCSSLTSETRPRPVWRTIGEVEGRRSTSSLGHLGVNGGLVADKKQIANLLASTISDNSS